MSLGFNSPPLHRSTAKTTQRAMKTGDEDAGRRALPGGGQGCRSPEAAGTCHSLPGLNPHIWADEAGSERAAATPNVAREAY